jgi:hypothetical protein
VNTVERHVGAPTVLEELKHTPGHQLTLRARGPRGSAIVELYSSGHVTSVAARIAALANGPPEPVVPMVLEVDHGAGLILLSDVPGTPLRDAALAHDEQTCRRAGHALGSWHAAWTKRVPLTLPVHTIRDELTALVDRASLAPNEIRLRVRDALRELGEEWPLLTAVHRNLSEETVLIWERVGLIEIEQAGVGPPELDIGNLLAHLDLLGLRSNVEPAGVELALLEGYRVDGILDDRLLDRCHRLARLRLACIHHEPRLLEPAQALSTAAP